MPRVPKKQMAELSIKHQPIVYQKMLFISQAPLLSAAEAKKLHENNRALVRSEGDNKWWCTLAQWLSDAPADDGVLCRKTALEIEIKKRTTGLPGGVNLLPFRRNYPSVSLEYEKNGVTQRQRMEAILDVRRGVLKLLLQFVNPDATEAEQAAGLNLYGEVLAAMSSPDGVRLNIKYGHEYRSKTPPPRVVFKPGTIRAKPAGSTVRTKPRISRAVPAQVLLNARVMATPAAPVKPPVARTTSTRRTPVVSNPALENMTFNRTLLIRPDHYKTIQKFRHTAVPPKKPPKGERTVSITGSTTPQPIRIQRPLSREDTYPDVRRESQQGWGSLSGPNGTLYYRDTPRGDTFQYLPTHFKLGFYVEGDGSTGRPPMRPEFYKRDGAYRVKATLVAVPWIDDADRDFLRRFLRDDLLLGTLPFVRLEPAGGLAADFLPTFTASTESGQVSLPANIDFTAVDVDLNDRVLLEFDMEASTYSIFAGMVRHGLHGKVKVGAEGLIQESIPVRLSLEDIAALPRQIPTETDGLADGVFIWQVVEAPEDEKAEPRTELTVLNTLDHPVSLSSLKVNLVDSGPVAGMIFDAEELDLAPGGKTLAASGDARGGDRFAVPLEASRIALWDETIPVPGSMRVDGGSAQDWLDRVHQDPSLQEAELAVTLRLVLPPDVGDLQIVRLRLLDAAGGGVRQTLDVLPTSEPVELPIRLTLQELAGSGGAAPRFLLEFDSVSVGGVASLPQRVPVDPDGGTMLLRPVIEEPGSIYMLEPSDGPPREGLSRDDAEDSIEEFRDAGVTWTVLARVPEVEEPTDPIEPPDTDPEGEDPATGTDVQVVTDLLAAAFADGSLRSVFVTLSADEDGAPTTTLSFDADHPEPRAWTPPAGVPPFRYKVTYLFGDGTAPRQVEGTETQPLLLLDVE